MRNEKLKDNILLYSYIFTLISILILIIILIH